MPELRASVRVSSYGPIIPGIADVESVSPIGLQWFVYPGARLAGPV